MLDKIIDNIRNESFTINPYTVFPDKPMWEGKVKGNLCEQSVRDVLDKYDFKRFNEFPEYSEYDWKRNGGVSVSKDGLLLFEKDDLGHFGNDFCSVEVKARLRKNMESLIHKTKLYCSELSVQEPTVLLFTPFNRIRKHEIRLLESLEKRHNFYAIDTGWDKKALDIEVQEYFVFQKEEGNENTFSAKKYQ